MPSTSLLSLWSSFTIKTHFQNFFGKTDIYRPNAYLLEKDFANILNKLCPLISMKNLFENLTSLRTRFPGKPMNKIFPDFLENLPLINTHSANVSVFQKKKIRKILLREIRFSLKNCFRSALNEEKKICLINQCWNHGNATILNFWSKQFNIF